LPPADVLLSTMALLGFSVPVVPPLPSGCSTDPPALCSGGSAFLGRR
jgi:hypothetical protein